ncbi:MAG: TIGR00269 family protein [Archaeoglobi archaeon]|nr:TIGR00269 family protein [Candidatus Mnemosynella bozhongmuii]
MRCSSCSEEAIITVKWKNKSYCEKHFRNYFIGQIRKVIDKYQVRGDVAVALSGGKDSTAMLEALTHFRELELHPFYLDLGIGNYSEALRKVCEELAQKLGLKLEVIDLKKEYGKSVEELSKRRRGAPCSICGTVKRYLMNRYAYETGADYLATGHNLSDLATFILNNLINSQIAYLRGFKPVVPGNQKLKLVSRLRPLYFLRDRETLVYNLVNKIPFSQEECPLSPGATTLELKSWVMRLEDFNPRALLNLMSSFERIEESIRSEGEIRNCEICGYATSGKVCKFCRLMR